MGRGITYIGVIALAVMASPAWAQGSVRIPEPTDMALFALAVVGVIIGRRSSKAPSPDDNDDA